MAPADDTATEKVWWLELFGDLLSVMFKVGTQQEKLAKVIRLAWKHVRTLAREEP